MRGRCDFCGFPLEEEVRYCTNCGECVETRCSSCGSTWPWDSRYCGGCGENLCPIEGRDDTTEETLIVTPVSEDTLRRAASQRAWRAEPAEFLLSMKAAELSLVEGFERLLCLGDVACELRPYQEKTCIKVLRDMWGCAILADEVGLGKTVEAGTILKEMLQRGLVSTALILVPPTLEDQWIGELSDKFSIPAASTRFKGWENSPVIISSIFRADSGSRKTTLEATEFDMLIVDEAQVMKNHNAKIHKFVYGLKKKYALLLSATPIQNDLTELYNLINVLKPGLLKTRRNFKARYVKSRFEADRKDELKVLLSQVMIRNRRSDTLVELPPRQVSALECELSPAEMEFHDGVVTLSRSIYSQYYQGTISLGWDNDKAQVAKLTLLLITLLRELCSSPAATVSTLESRVLPRLASEPEIALTKDLIDRGKALDRPTKALKLIEHMEQHRGEKMVIYAEFHKTQDVLARLLKDAGYDVVVFNGSLTQRQKTLALERFKVEADVLLSGEVGGQGLNLQFAHVLYNYDLPWNPMRVEQRIGRLHRFGQAEPVEITSVHTRGTIEEYILHIMTSKVDLFRMVVGEIDTIMSYMTAQKSLEVMIGEIVLNSASPEEMRKLFTELGDEIRAAQKKYEADRDTVDENLKGINLSVM